jgi:hypothetical protein
MISKEQFEEMQSRIELGHKLKRQEDYARMQQPPRKPDLKEYEQRDKKRSDPANPAPALPPTDKKRTQGDPLERPVSGKEESRPRFKIEFHVYAVRPCDYDGYHIKELQDMVVKSGILPDDDWRTLRGEVIPHKVYTEAEEETRILIIEL